MMTLALCACAATLAAGVSASAASKHAPQEPRPYVLGGGPADPAQWPYAAAILYRGKFICSGSVIGPREVLMEIVPEEKRLIVEARLRPEDINHVRPGSSADVRLTAYQQRTTPLVHGSVIYVSGDRMIEQPNGAPYYVVQVDVPGEALVQAGNLKLQAGMPAEVFIRTDERTTVDYLLAPLTAYLRRAMREPL